MLGRLGTFGDVDARGPALDVQDLALLDHVVEVADAPLQLVLLLHAGLDALVEDGEGVCAQARGRGALREVGVELHGGDQLLGAEGVWQAGARAQRVGGVGEFGGDGLRRRVGAAEAVERGFRGGEGFGRRVGAREAVVVRRGARGHDLARDAEGGEGRRRASCEGRGGGEGGRQGAVLGVEVWEDGGELVVGHVDAELQGAEAVAAAWGGGILDAAEAGGCANVRPAHAIVLVQLPLHGKVPAARCAGCEASGPGDPFGRRGGCARPVLGLWDWWWDELGLEVEDCHRFLNA